MGLARGVEMGQFPCGGLLVCCCHGVKIGEERGRGRPIHEAMPLAWRVGMGAANKV
jgi:hypothetical protein